MKYESLKIEVINLNSSDVIATSQEVTTGGITMPWTSNDATAPTSFIPGYTDPSNYNI